MSIITYLRRKSRKNGRQRQGGDFICCCFARVGAVPNYDIHLKVRYPLCPCYFFGNFFILFIKNGKHVDIFLKMPFEKISSMGKKRVFFTIGSYE